MSSGSKGSILVTPRSLSGQGHPELQRLTDAGYSLVFPAPGRQPEEQDLVASMDKAVGYLAGVEPVTKTVIQAGSMLKVIGRNGVGTDNIDLQAARSAGIVVAPALGANSRGVAELALASMLCAARGLTRGDAALKNGQWQREQGMELEGKTLGLVGCGRIGMQVARFGQALGMSVLATDPYPPVDRPSGMSFTGFSTVIQESDVISLHCPPLADAFIIDAEAIASMKQGVILVNTARAGLIDEQAALDALDSGQISWLTNDAYASEPPEDWTLISHPRVIASAHCGGYTAESIDRATTAAVSNILDILEKRNK